MGSSRIYLLIGIIGVFASVSECSIISSIWNFITGDKGPNFNLTRTCFKVPKNLHLPVFSNDCESVENDPSQPINKLVEADNSDSLKNPFFGDIHLYWLVGAPYKSPYTGEETNLKFSFEIAYEDDPLKNKLLNPVEPHKKYKNGTEKKFAKELTALFIASKVEAPVNPANVVNKKNVKSDQKQPKFLRCKKPVSFKIRFYTTEVPNQPNMDYMYMTYKGKIHGC